MNSILKHKLDKIAALVRAGATEGEKQAAEQALNRLLKKYDLEDYDPLAMQEYRFKYSRDIDKSLFFQICKKLIDTSPELYRDTYRVKEIIVKLHYEDYVVVDAAYAYFKKHMHQQYRKTMLPLINRKRKASTRAKLRRELNPYFLGCYLKLSGLVDDSDLLTKVSSEDTSFVMNIEGGKYHSQITTGLMLEQ